MLRFGFFCVSQSILVIFPSPYPNLFIAPTFMAAAARACAVSLVASQHKIAIVLVSMSARGGGCQGAHDDDLIPDIQFNQWPIGQGPAECAKRLN